MNDTDYLSLKEAEDEISISAAVLRRAILEGRLRGEKIGSMWVVKRDWLNAYKVTYRPKKRG